MVQKDIIQYQRMAFSHVLYFPLYGYWPDVDKDKAKIIQG